MKSNYKLIGDLIDTVDERNKALGVETLLGVNKNKGFMPSIANSTDLDLSKYKVLRKGRFACNLMHVGRDEVLPVALYSNEDLAIVSPAYITFEIKDPSELIPEFLMMFLHRSEFDRYAWFISDSSIRGGLEWSRFCEIEVPVPSIEVQKPIVALYSAIESRVLLNEQIRKLIAPVSPVLLAGGFANSTGSGHEVH
jgi:type I restriction enzyme S subunit